MVSARRANTSRRSGAKTTGGRGLGASPWAWRAVQPHSVVRAGDSTRGAVYRLLCEWPSREPSCQTETSSARKSRGGERERRSDQGREVSSQCVLVSKRRGWPSCKQTQDARREVDSRAAKGHSTPHPSYRGGREVTGALGDVGRVGVESKKQPTTPLIECPAAAAAAARWSWSWGRCLPLFFSLVSLGSDAVGRPGCRVVRECVCRYSDRGGERGDVVGRFPHTSDSLAVKSCSFAGGGVNGWTLESRSTSSPPQEFPSTNMANAPLPLEPPGG
jgi:hypothetical protein